MVIRDAGEADFDAIAEITNYYIVNTPIHFSYERVTADELRAGWRKGVGVYPYLALVDDAGAVIGYAKAGRWRDRAAYDKTAEVGIYLRHDLHGRGWGKALYLRLIEECRRMGMHTLVGGVALPNEASSRLHEACGFVFLGTFREVGWKFEAWHDVGWYQLML